MDLILENETLDDLQLKNIHIIQKKDNFRFGVDAILLANFAKLKDKESAMDLCTGTGIVPFVLAGKTNSNSIRGIEIQSDMVDMANRSVRYNKLNNRVNFINADLTDLEFIKKLTKVNVVTVNPPYKLKDSGISNPVYELAIARHEICCNLEDVIISSKLLLNHGGRFYMVHRPERLVDILTLMRKYKLEPKRIKLVQPTPSKAPNIVLIEGKNNGGSFLKWEAPLSIHKEDGSYSKELQDIYNSDTCIL